jgi:anaerobic sulfite reductase subunit B
VNANTYKSKRVEITEVIRHTAVDFSYRLAGALPMRSGQFVEVSLPGIGEAPFSVSDFGDDFIELTIRKVGRLTDAVHALRVGDGLWVRGPYGNGFPVEAFEGRHLIIAAGGTGVAPVKSLIERYVVGAGSLKDLDAVLGFRSPSDVLFSNDIARWSRSLRLLLTVDRGNEEWRGNVGLITRYVPGIAIPDPAGADVVIVGPPAMMKFTSQAFLERGIPQEHVWLSFERNMHCGTGKCGHCKIVDHYVCLDGPIFPFSEAKRLID